jgi:ribose transport system permease protein
VTGTETELSKGRLVAFARRYAIVIAVAILAGALAIGTDNFLTRINLLNTIEAGAVYGTVALGLTVLLIAGEFDLSAGATCVLAGIVAAALQPVIGNWPALGAGVLAGACVGAANGVAVGVLRINSFIATLATSLVVVGIGTSVTSGYQLYIAEAGFGLLGNGKIGALSGFVVLYLALAAALGLLLSRTRTGRWLYVIGDNPEAARMAGVALLRLRVTAFVIGGAAAGIAGAILVSRTGTAIAGSGLSDVLFPAVAAVVVGGSSIRGGSGAIWRTVLGVLFLELVRNGFNLLEVNSYYQGIALGVIILLAVGFDPQARRNI